MVNKDVDLITFSELLDKLMTINIKLYHVLDESASLDHVSNKTEDIKQRIVELNGENIKLIKQRSLLKTMIDTKLNIAIQNGGTQILDEVKKYGI